MSFEISNSIITILGSGGVAILGAIAGGVCTFLAQRSLSCKEFEHKNFDYVRQKKESLYKDMFESFCSKEYRTVVKYIDQNHGEIDQAKLADILQSYLEVLILWYEKNESLFCLYSSNEINVMLAEINTAMNDLADRVESFRKVGFNDLEIEPVIHLFRYSFERIIKKILEQMRAELGVKD